MAAYDMERDEIFVPKKSFLFIPNIIKNTDHRFIRKPTTVFFGRGSQAPSIPTKDVGAGLVAGALAGMTTAFLAFLVSNGAVHLVDPDSGTALMHIKGWLAGHMHGVMAEGWLDAREEWLAAAKPLTKSLVAASGFLSALGGLAISPLFFKAFSVPMDGHQHIDGRRVLDNDEARKAWINANLNECKGVDGKVDPKMFDLEIIPGVPTSRDRLKKHGLVLGPPGSGKTVLLAPFMERGIRSGARSLYFDIKGDFTELFYEETWDKNNALTDPGKPSKNNGIVLMCPFDKRTDVWDIAADIRDKQEAVEFAEANIPTGEGESRMWTQSAQAVVIGCVHMLQCEKPGVWTCGDLAALLGQTNMKVFIEILRRYHPEGIKALDTADVTQAGVMTNVMAAMAPIFSLADAWPERIEGKMFSVRKWAEASGSELDDLRKTVILKGNPKYPAIVKACAGAIFQLAQSILTSLPDDPTRDVYIILDEFPELGKVEILRLITLGRSKGIGVWLAMQTLNQIKKVHGEDVANAIKNSVTTFITMGALGPDCMEISELIGERTVERMSVSGTGPNAVVTPQLQTMKTISPAQIALIGTRAGVGVKAGIWGKGLDDFLLIDLPFASRLKRHPLKKVGRPEVLADWVKAENSMAMMGQRLKRAEEGAKFLRGWAEKYKTDIAEKKQGTVPATPAPNYLDPSKPFTVDPADDLKTTEEKRKKWAAEKYKLMKGTASDGMVEAPTKAKPMRLDEEDETEGVMGSSVSAKSGDLAIRISSTNDLGELESMLTEVKGGPAEKMLRARISSLRRRNKVAAGQDVPPSADDASRKVERTTIDPPIYVPNPAAQGRSAPPEDGPEDPLAEAVAEHAETALLGSLLGTHIAEILVHVADAAEKSAPGGPRAGPSAMIPIYQPPRKT